MAHEILTNFLKQDELKDLKAVIENVNMPWYFFAGVANYKDTSDAYLSHTFFDDGKINSGCFQVLTPMLMKLNCKQLIRARANLYLSKPTLIEHAKHTDYDYEHKAFVFYLNTNDGFTRLEDGTVVNSIENQGVLFDGSKLHNSTNCTNAPSRITLSINYL